MHMLQEEIIVSVKLMFAGHSLNHRSANNMIDSVSSPHVRPSKIDGSDFFIGNYFASSFFRVNKLHIN